MPAPLSSFPRPLKSVVYTTAFFGWSVGCLVIAGWAFNIPVLKSVVPGFIAMQPWTATSFIFGACGLALAGLNAPVVRSTSAVPALVAGTAAGLPLLQYCSGTKFGTDVWLFPTTVLSGQTHDYSDPGRMSQAAALGLTALAGALLLAPRINGRAGRAAFSTLATVALATSLLSLLSYVLRLEPLDAMFQRNPLALHSALTLAALAIGTLALRPDAGWVGIVAEQGPAGWMTAILLGIGALLLVFGTDAATRAGTVAASASEASRRLEILLSTVKDAESGQRGYLLTNSQDYLQPYLAARDRLPGEFSAVAASLVAVAEHPVSLDRLQHLVTGKMTELAETIALARAGHIAKALDVVETGRGKAAMDSVRNEIDALEQTVDDDASDRGGRARRIATVAASGIIGLASLAFWALIAAGRAQKRSAAALAASAARQQDLLTTLGLGSFIARDLNGTIRYWAGGCERLYGWTAAEAAGRSVHELLSTIFPVPLPEIDAALQSTGEWSGDLRHKTRDGQDLVVTAHKVLRRGGNGQPPVVLEALTDVTAQRHAETALRDSQTLLRTIIETTPGLIYAKDRQGRMLMANSAAVSVIGKSWIDLEGQTDRDFLKDPMQGEVVMLNDQQVMEAGKTLQLEELVNQPNGQHRVFLSNKTPMRNACGTISGLVGVSIDITERKRDTERLRLMVNELNHRVKNTLATVQSITSQTLRGVDPGVRRNLEGRLQALASVHDVLTRERWKEAYLHEVIESALAPFSGSGPTRFEIAGEPLRVQPRVAVATSLALHELATNAIKYGALSTPTGQVAIRWDITPDAEPAFHMVWTERGGPPVIRPESRGFGSRLIERSLAQDLGGTARLAFDVEGVTCTIDAKLREVVADHETVFPSVGDTA